MAPHRKLAHPLQSEGNVRSIVGFCRLLLLALVLAIISSCATTDVPWYISGQEPPPSPEEREEKGREASQAHLLWAERCQKFFRESCSLLYEVELLQDYPGWSDMAIIIKSKRSIRHIEGAQEAERKTNIAIVKWSQKWEAPGDRLYAAYLELAKWSKQLEVRRLGLLDEWHQVYLKKLAYYASLNTSNMIRRLSLLEKWNTENREELRSLGIDSIDLFYADTQKLKQMLPNYPWP